MANKLREWTSQRRSLILMSGMLLVIAALAIVAVGVFWQREDTGIPVDQLEGRTNPVLVDTSDQEDAAMPIVKVGVPGAGGVKEGGDGLLLISLSQGQAGRPTRRTCQWSIPLNTTLPRVNSRPPSGGVS